MTLATRLATSIQIAKLVCLICAAFLCIAAGTVALKAGSAISVTSAQVNMQLVKLDHTQQLLDKVLVNSKNLIIHLDMTANEAQKVSRKESLFIDSMNTKVSNTIDNANVTLNALTKNQNELTLHSVQAIDAVTTAVNGIQPVLTQTKVTLEATQGAVSDLKTVIDNPSIPKTIDSVAGMSESGNRILKDGADEVHNLLHPNKKTGIRATINAVVMYLDHLLPPIF